MPTIGRTGEPGHPHVRYAMKIELKQTETMKKYFSAIFGLALGLFTGLLIIGTVIRLIFSLVSGGATAHRCGAYA